MQTLNNYLLIAVFRAAYEKVQHTSFELHPYSLRVKPQPQPVTPSTYSFNSHYPLISRYNPYKTVSNWGHRNFQSATRPNPEIPKELIKARERLQAQEFSTPLDFRQTPSPQPKTGPFALSVLQRCGVLWMSS